MFAAVDGVHGIESGLTGTWPGTGRRGDAVQSRYEARVTVVYCGADGGVPNQGVSVLDQINQQRGYVRVAEADQGAQRMFPAESVAGAASTCGGLRDVQIAARHADPRTTMRYDRARKNSTGTRTTSSLRTWHPGLDALAALPMSGKRSLVPASGRNGRAV